MNINGGKPPRWMVVTLIVTIVAVVALTVGAWYIAKGNCEDAVESQAHDRVVWVALIEANPGPRADMFREEILDVYLPELKCDGNKLVEA